MSERASSLESRILKNVFCLKPNVSIFSINCTVFFFINSFNQNHLNTLNFEIAFHQNSFWNIESLESHCSLQIKTCSFNILISLILLTTISWFSVDNKFESNECALFYLCFNSETFKAIRHWSRGIFSIRNVQEKSSLGGSVSVVSVTDMKVGRKIK